MQAIILAAGKGSRLAPFHDEPKSLIRFGAKTILEEMIGCLHANRVHNIVLVTGYRAEKFLALIEQNGLHAVVNEKYESAGSLRSLLLAKPLIAEDALVIEADVVCECRALQELLQSRIPNLALLSETSGNGDEMYAFGSLRHLTLLSKQRNQQVNCVGEFVGITKLSREFLKSLFNSFGGYEEANSTYDTDGLMHISNSFIPLAGLVVPDLIWTEIDDITQFRRAQETVYPALIKRRSIS